MMDAVLQPHGSWRRYRQGCRCARCTKAMQGYKLRLARKKNGLPPATRYARMPLHGTTERYRLKCRCRPCVRAWKLYLAVTREWVSLKDPVLHLTRGDAFLMLVLEILELDDEISAAIRAKVHARAEERRRRELAGAPSRAAAEIALMDRRSIERLMRPDFPTWASTRRNGTARLVALVAPPPYLVGDEHLDDEARCGSRRPLDDLPDLLGPSGEQVPDADEPGGRR